MLPVGLGHELGKTGVVGIGDEIAGRFPAERVASGVAPRGAIQLEVARYEVQVNLRYFYLAGSFREPFEL